MQQVQGSLLGRDAQKYRTVSRAPLIDSSLYVAIAFALAGLIATGISAYFEPRNLPGFDLMVD